MKLFNHQNYALDETEPYNRTAYYMDMGLGKTFVGAEKMRQLGTRINLIVCQKSKVQDWFEHMVVNYAMNHRWIIYDLTKKNDLEMFVNATTSIQSHSTDWDNQTICGVINYDLLYRRSYFTHMTNFTLMLDESSIIQNETSKRAKFVLKMKPDNVILLSGTPTAGKYEKLWSQIHLLGWNISKQLFYKQYVDIEYIHAGKSGFKYPVIHGYKNVDRLKRKLAEYGAIFMTTDEAFELPQQIEIDVKVQVSKEYKKFMKTSYLMFDARNYCEVKREPENDFWGKENTSQWIELIGNTVLTKRMYARQLCTMYSKEKLTRFRELLESTEDRLIVFYNFNEELNKLKKIALEYTDHISIVNGETRDLKAYERHNDAITFVQYQAGAMGLNLQKANKVIYFSPTDKSELFEQSKKRIHRIGQEKTCFYYYMVCPDSVETSIYEALKMRKDYTDELFKKEFST